MSALQVLTVEQVSALLGCSEKTVMARASELGGIKFGVAPVFPAEALQRRLVEIALAAPKRKSPAPAPVAAVLVQPEQSAKQRRAPPKLPALQLAGQST